MEVFFNELSIKLASNEEEAGVWLHNLATILKSLKEVNDIVDELGITFKAKQDFLERNITNSKKLREFIIGHAGYNNPMYNFLLGFDFPCIDENDFERHDFDYKDLVFEDQNYSHTGLVAAFLKNSIAISLNNDHKWSNCLIDLKIEGISSEAKTFKVEESVRNISKIEHLRNCHLPYIADKFDYSSLNPKFDFNQNIITDLLPLISICSLYLHTDKNEALIWREFYEEINKLDTNERIDKVKNIATKIATIHKWLPATGSLKKRNSNRTIYTVPNSNFIMSIDTQHGEFEVHIDKKGNNHLGAVRFDGKKIKPPVPSRSLEI